MKKTIVFSILGLALLSIPAFAQKAESTTCNGSTNLQFFYDFAGDRQHVTTTLEGFYMDPWGDTFFFVDYDYSTKDGRDYGNYGVQGSYFEIARGINFWKDTALGALSAHVEYNGGVGFGNSNWLFGANYGLHSADFKNIFTFELMYKTFNGGASSDLPLQFTFVWGMDDIFGVKGLRFSGFADIWGENVVNFMEPDFKSASCVFLSEPQLWYNLGQHFGCSNLNIGGEIELSANFAGYNGFKCRPCLGVKWIF